MCCTVSRLSQVVLFLLSIAACNTPSAQSCGTSGRPTVGKAGRWPNEPPGLTVVSDVPLGAAKEGWRCEGAGLSAQADSAAPQSSAHALVFTYEPGFLGGLAPGVAFYDLPTPTKETFFGFWWKPSAPWQSHPSGINKIALLFPITSSAGTIYIMMFFDGTNYTIQVETTFASDNRRLAPTVTATPVVLGAWHQIEWYVRYSTSATSRDGIVRWWLDGVLQGEHTDLQMPGDSGFGEYTIRPVWGGVEQIKTETDRYWYGDVHISRR